MSITVTSFWFVPTFPSFSIVDIDKLLGKNIGWLGCLFGRDNEEANGPGPVECNTLWILLLWRWLRLPWPTELYYITGGSVRGKKVKPKTWRISAFADAIMTPLVLVDHEVYHWPRLILSRRPFPHPPGFCKYFIANFKFCLLSTFFFDFKLFVWKYGCRLRFFRLWSIEQAV